MLSFFVVVLILKLISKLRFPSQRPIVRGNDTFKIPLKKALMMVILIFLWLKALIFAILIF